MTLGAAFTPEARDQALARAAHALSAELVAFGQSVQGRALVAARIPSTRTGPVPRVLLCANIHGVEYAGVHAAFHLMEWMQQPGPAMDLRARAEVWVAPSLNPDGYARTFESGGRGTMAELRTNARGVDLNRNFPLPFGASPSRLPFTGSSTPGAATYRGPAPLSEPEAAAADALLRAHRFHAVLSLHSFMGTVIHARVRGEHDFAAYGRLSEAFRSAQPRWGYHRVGSRHVDAWAGELEDHAHNAYGAWSACIEMFPVFHALRQALHEDTLFWRMNPRQLDAYVRNDVPGMVAFFMAALDEPAPAHVTPPS